jgi:hypothetical protein
VDGDGLYAVVRKFVKPGTIHPHSNIVREGILENKMYLLPLESIEDPIAVVRNHGDAKKYFVVGNKSVWLQSFLNKAELLPSTKSLYRLETKYPQQFPHAFNNNVVVE